MLTPLDSYFAAQKRLVLGTQTFSGRLLFGEDGFHQAATSDIYFLTDEQSAAWILKKPPFFDERRLSELQARLPASLGEHVARRRIVTAQDVQGLTDVALAEYLRGAILMPKAPGTSWGELAADIRRGKVKLDLLQRLLLCENLYEQIRVLENLGLAHTDLSHSNVWIDRHRVCLIDWEDAFMAGAPSPLRLSRGTEGYIAPYLRDDDHNWQSMADRFAATVLCAELLLMREGLEPVHDGGMMSQDDICSRVIRANRFMPEQPLLGRVLPLYLRALNARSPQDVPSPETWLKAIGEEKQRLQDSALEAHQRELERVGGSAPTSTRKLAPLVRRTAAVAGIGLVTGLGTGAGIHALLQAPASSTAASSASSMATSKLASTLVAPPSSEPAPSSSTPAVAAIGSSLVDDAINPKPPPGPLRLSEGAVVRLASGLGLQRAHDFAREFPKGTCVEDFGADIQICVKQVKRRGYSVLIGTALGLTQSDAGLLVECYAKALGDVPGRAYSHERDRPVVDRADKYRSTCLDSVSLRSVPDRRE